MEDIMTYAQSFFGWLLQMTLIASVVTCLILLIQKVLGGKLGPRWCHALWLVLLIRMILPWAPSSRVSLFNLVPSWDRQIQRAQSSESTEQQGPSHAGQTSNTAEAIPARKSESDVTIQKQVIPEPGAIADIQIESQSRLVSLRRVLPVLWLAGSIVIGAYLLISNFTLWRIVKRDSPLVNQTMLELFEECKAQMGVQSLVVVVPSSQIRSPALFGFIRPRLLLPSEMLEKASHEEMRYVFLHELAHLKRRDIYLGWLTSLLQVLHWFNPLVWFAFYRMRADRELACDALVLARTQKEESQEYGQAIVGLVRRFSRSRTLPAMAGILESKSQLKRRIAMIAQFKKNSYQWSPLAVILIIILGCVSLPNTKNSITLGSIISGDGSRVTLRRIMEYESYYSNVSLDGKYLCDQKWDGDITSLYALELDTGTRKILVRSDPNTGSIGWGDPSISIDNKMVAYRWWDNERETYDLHIVGMDGSNHRTLVEDKRIFPKNWSADGRRILGLRPFREAGWELVWVSTDNGSVSTIKPLPKERGVTSSRVDLSPDGRNIAYDARNPRVGLAKFNIFLLDIDNNIETALEYPGNNRLVGWTPDGKYILFNSDNNDTQDLLLMSIVDGKFDGRPRLIRRDIGSFRPIGITQDGACYYTTAYRFSTVYTAMLNLNMGKLLSAPKPVIQGQGVYWCMAWSPGGKYLAYCQRGNDGSTDIHIKPFTGDVERVINTGLPNIRWISWAPTGESIIVSFLSPGGGGSLRTDMMRSVYKIDVETGEKSVLFKSDVGRPIHSEFSPDGKRIIYNCLQAKPHDSLVIRDLETGKERKIFEFSEQYGWKYWWDLSPDGQYIAIGAPGVDSPSQLKIISIDGKEHKELLPQDWGKIFDVIWASDGKTVLFTSQGVLWQISAEGGEPRKLLTPEQLGVASRPSICLHPDGQRVDFLGSEYSEELWVMDNFLPEKMSK
jgi:beta-lactamase regulating signal transducer with metallopeptidase domain/Tol biopolymer transport system component